MNDIWWNCKINCKFATNRFFCLTWSLHIWVCGMLVNSRLACPSSGNASKKSCNVSGIVLTGRPRTWRTILCEMSNWVLEEKSLFLLFWEELWNVVLKNANVVLSQENCFLRRSCQTFRLRGTSQSGVMSTRERERERERERDKIIWVKEAEKKKRL